MDTDIKKLLKAERENWKKRMVKETKGTYIAIYLGLIFCVFMSAMFGFKYDYSSDDKRIMITLTVFIFGVYQGVTTYVSYVRENGKSVNIFEKYKYIPVDVLVLRRVKLILTARIIAPFVITGQMAAIFVRVINLDNQGGSLIDISVFIVTDIILPEEKAREKCLISGLILKIPSKTLRSRDVLTRENVLRLYEKVL